ncbi:Hypothetical protein SCF082_LOCUS44638 [Durusdinium trenchii]
MAIMTNMGLHVFHPEWQTVPSGSMPRGRQYSTTFKSTTIRVFGGDEEITFPVQTCTKSGDAFAQNSAANNHLLGRSSVTSLPAMYANAMNNAAWSLSMDLGEKQYCAQYDDYGYDYEGNFQDWMYYVDEIETTDTGSYTPSEVETIEAFFDPCGTTPTVNSPMGGSVKVLAPDPLVHKQPQSPVLVLLVLARSR